MRYLDILRAFQVRNRAANFQQPVIRPSRKTQLLNGGAEEALNFIARFAVKSELFRSHLGVAVEWAVFLQSKDGVGCIGSKAPAELPMQNHVMSLSYSECAPIQNQTRPSAASTAKAR